MTAKATLRDSVRAALTENVGLKVISLVTAIGIYAFIHGAENAQRTFSVSVVSIMPPESANRQLMIQLPTEVAVTLRGTRTQLDDLRADELGTLQLDLRNGRDARVDLDAGMFHVPPGLVIQQIYPTTIELRWDDVVTRPIAVQVSRTGEPAAGFAVRGSITVDPPTVTARGPRSFVDVLQFARAAPFDVTGLTEGTFRRALAIDRPPKLVEYDVETANATVEIARELLTKQLTGLKVEVVGLPRATTTPKLVTVKITGPAEELNQLLPEAVVPRVEPKAANLDTSVPGSAYLDVLVDVPRARVEASPPRVLVKW